MKISVIVPAYNSELFLAETLDCLINQTLKDIEIIVVNDGSTDGTSRIAEGYARKHSNLRVISQANAGVSAARNAGIESARGKYTLFLDSDDLFTPNSLEEFHNALEKAGADLAICRIRSFGVRMGEFNQIVDSIASESNIEPFDKRLLWNYLIPNKCYRTELLKKSGVRFSPIRYSEDGAFFIQFLCTARPKITGAYNAVAEYRRHTKEQGLSVTQKIDRRLIEDFTKAHGIIYACAEQALKNGECSDPDGYLQELIYKNYYSLINEFYRLLWQTDDETLAYIGELCNSLCEKMTDETLKKACAAFPELGSPLFSKREISQNPIISVIAGKCEPAFIESLFSQSTPMFELISVRSDNLPKHENVVALPNSGFKKAARAQTKGKIKIFLSGKKALDSRFLKIVILLKRSRKFSYLPDFVIKFGARLLMLLRR